MKAMSTSGDDGITLPWGGWPEDGYPESAKGKTGKDAEIRCAYVKQLLEEWPDLTQKEIGAISKKRLGVGLGVERTRKIQEELGLAVPLSPDRRKAGGSDKYRYAKLFISDNRDWSLKEVNEALRAAKQPTIAWKTFKTLHIEVHGGYKPRRTSSTPQAPLLHAVPPPPPGPRPSISAAVRGTDIEQFLLKLPKGVDIDTLINLAEMKAKVYGDGHLSLMRFTTGWKCFLGTPDLDTGDGREQVWHQQMYSTISEALMAFIVIGSPEPIWEMDLIGWEKLMEQENSLGGNGSSP